MKKAGLFLIMFMLVSQVFAQEELEPPYIYPEAGRYPTYGNIKGKVTAMGRTEEISLVGAEVIAKDEDGKEYPESGPAITNYAGAYEIRDLEPGYYVVRVSAKGYEEQLDSLKVFAGITSDHDVRLALALGFIEGKVTARKGAIADAYVNVEGKEIENPIIEKTNSMGRYKVSDLPAGKYTVTVEKPGYEKSTESVQVDADQETTHDVKLARPAKLLMLLAGIAVAFILLVAVIVVLAAKLRK